MLLVLHKMTFHENEAAYLCVSMRNVQVALGLFYAI